MENIAAMPMWRRVTVWALRVAIGAVFVMSGLSKMIDLWGFVFKIEEYLAVWHMTQPRTIVFMGALLLSGYEFVLGALLLMGCYKRVASWGLMLSMVFMLPLTFYIVLFNPVSDCGCFGDFWKISDTATFLKNVIITAGLLYLLKWNHRLRESLFKPAIQWMVGAWLSLYILIVGLYGYNVQPMVDFRAFPEGTLLVGSDADDAVGEDDFLFVYRKGNEERRFAIDELPDSTWEFVDRVPASAAGGAAAGASAATLAVFDGDEDVTQEVIGGEGRELLLVVPEPRRAGITFSYTVNEIKEFADSAGIPMLALLGTDTRGVERWKDDNMAEYPCYTADDTQLKELARGIMSLVMLQDGRVASKIAIGAVDPGITESNLSAEEFADEIDSDGRGWFMVLNLLFGGALLLLYLCQGIILAIRAKFRRAYRKKHAKNS